jgi:hypothetical protein
MSRQLFCFYQHGCALPDMVAFASLACVVIVGLT